MSRQEFYNDITKKDSVIEKYERTFSHSGTAFCYNAERGQHVAEGQP